MGRCPRLSYCAPSGLRRAEILEQHFIVWSEVQTVNRLCSFQKYPNSIVFKQAHGFWLLNFLRRVSASSFSPLTPAREELISRRGFARSPLRGEGARRACLVIRASTAAFVAFAYPCAEAEAHGTRRRLFHSQRASHANSLSPQRGEGWGEG